jgi:hypothetical protein
MELFTKEEIELLDKFATGMSLVCVAKNETVTRLQYFLFGSTVPIPNSAYFPRFGANPSNKQLFYADVRALYAQAKLVVDKALAILGPQLARACDGDYEAFVQTYDATYRDQQRLRRVCAAMTEYQKTMTL